MPIAVLLSKTKHFSASECLQLQWSVFYQSKHFCHRTDLKVTLRYSIMLFYSNVSNLITLRLLQVVDQFTCLTRSTIKGQNPILTENICTLCRPSYQWKKSTHLKTIQTHPATATSLSSQPVAVSPLWAGRHSCMSPNYKIVSVT